MDGTTTGESQSFGRLRILNNQASGLYACTPEWNWNPPPLADYDLWYVLSGRGTIRLNGHNYPVSKGSLFLFRPGDRVAGEQDLSDRLTVIYIHLRIADALTGEDMPPQDVLPRCLKVEDPLTVENLLYRLLENGDRSDEWAEDEFDGLMKLLLIHLRRQNRQLRDGNAQTARHARALRQVMLAVRTEGSQTSTHEQLAELAGLSAPYLNKLFKQHTGFTIREYRSRVRMERAQHLLSETTMNVSEVARTLGFADVFGFSKQFKKYFGHPPSRLR